VSCIVHNSKSRELTTSIPSANALSKHLRFLKRACMRIPLTVRGHPALERMQPRLGHFSHKSLAQVTQKPQVLMLKWLFCHRIFSAQRIFRGSGVSHGQRRYYSCHNVTFQKSKKEKKREFMVLGSVPSAPASATPNPSA
jgi:hypothetical protein